MIGVFDSGLGGLSVLRAILEKLPATDISYIADAAHVPYGEKSEQFICKRTLCLGEFLAHKGHQMLVIACNTATAAGGHVLREALPHLHVVGIEPGIKPAAQATKTGKIAVLTTSVTAKSARLESLIALYAKDLSVAILPCQGFANQVESLRLNDEDFFQRAKARLEPVLRAGVDQVVLGCTHYSFLRPSFEKVIDGRAEIVDVSEAVANRCLELSTHDTTKKETGRLSLFCTAHPERMQASLYALGLSHFVERQNHSALLLDV